MAISIGLNGYLQVSDSVSGTIALQKTLSGLSNAGLTGFGEMQQGSYGTGGSAITLPVSPAQFVYIKNTHGSQTLTVTWTPNGGSSNPVITLEPGSYIIMGEIAAGAGITALTLTGSGAATTAEWIIGG